MTKFQLFTMCAACNWKIQSYLKEKGISDFTIDHVNSILTFNKEVDPTIIVKLISNIGYHAELIPDEQELSDEELLMFEEELRRGY